MTTITISLPDTVARQVDDHSKKGGFATRSEFIRDLLRKFFTASEPIDMQPFRRRPLSEIKADLAKTGKYNQEFIDDVIEGLSKSSLYAHPAASQ